MIFLIYLLQPFRLLFLFLWILNKTGFARFFDVAAFQAVEKLK